LADYLESTALSGIADGKAFVAAFTFNYDNTVTDQSVFMLTTSTTERFSIRINRGAAGTVSVTGFNSSGTQILRADTTDLIFVTGRNYTVVVSLDLTDTGKRFIYINGVSAAVTWTTYTNDDIDFAVAATPVFRVGIGSGSGQFFNGRLGNIYFNTSYIDLSAARNLAKFVTGTGMSAKPVDLGATGELPTGTDPLIYLPMYGNNAGKNYGSGGDFTVNSGPFTGARGPNEFWGNRASFNGTTSVISKTAQLSGIADSKVFLLSFFIKKTGSVLYTICDTTGAAVRVTIDASNQLVIVAENSSGTAILGATVTTTITNSTNIGNPITEKITAETAVIPPPLMMEVTSILPCFQYE
jgi:hypothetical protein